MKHNIELKTNELEATRFSLKKGLRIVAHDISVLDHLNVKDNRQFLETLKRDIISVLDKINKII